jgi:transcriptional regulator with XRE-family HTH domain
MAAIRAGTTETGLGSRHRHVVGHRLRQRRRTLGLTQRDVAARLGELGTTTTNKALSSLENGATLDAAKLPELARALHCSVTYLLGLTDDPRQWVPDRDAEPAVARPPSAAQEPAAPADGPTRPWILGPDVPNRDPSAHVHATPSSMR